MGKTADVLERMDYATYARIGDIYSLFYELRINLLSFNGYLCYITSSKINNIINQLIMILCYK